MRLTANDPPVDHDQEKINMLQNTFFPARTPANLSDILDQPWEEQGRDTYEIIACELQKVIMGLPKGKAPGPDSIPNEVLQRLDEGTVAQLALAINRCLQAGKLPQSYQESTTIALCKYERDNYSLP